MNLNLRRFLFEGSTTLGMLELEKAFKCWTLEDLPREIKIKHETAIPTGTYRIELTDKNKWGKMMPHILSVPGFEGIYFHAGNTKEDTSGCVLVANALVTPQTNAGSRAAFDDLMIDFNIAWNAKEDIILSVENYIQPLT